MLKYKKEPECENDTRGHLGTLYFEVEVEIEEEGRR